MTAETGCSGTPLPQKPGPKDGQRLAFCALPPARTALATTRACRQVNLVEDRAALAPAPRDAIHLFTTQAETLRAALPALHHHIAPAVRLWINWPRKASRGVADITEDVIRDVALPDTGVDVKVCAVDAVCSGLKLMIRRTAGAGVNATQ